MLHAGGLKSFSVVSPHLVRSDLWNDGDVADIKLGDTPSLLRQLPTDTFRCHPSADQVLTQHYE